MFHNRKTARTISIDPEDNVTNLEQRLVKERPGLLFKTDDQGSLTGLNEPMEHTSGEAPLLYACLGLQHTIISTAAATPPEGLSTLIRLFEENAGLNKLSYEELTNYIIGASAQLGRNININIANAFYIPETHPIPGDVVEINQENKSYIKQEFPGTYTHLDGYAPCFAKLVDKKTVSLCQTVRKGRMPMVGDGKFLYELDSSR